MEPNLVAQTIFSYGLTIRPDTLQSIMQDIKNHSISVSQLEEYAKNLVKALREANPELSMTAIIDQASLSKVISGIQTNVSTTNESDETIKMRMLCNNSIFFKNSFPKYSNEKYSIISGIDDFYKIYKKKLVYIEKYITECLDFSRVPNGKHLLAYSNGLAGLAQKCTLLGILHQKSYGHYYLEDTMSSIELDITNATVSQGFINEGQIILAYGYLKGILFYVETLSHPPLIFSNMLQASNEFRVNDGIQVLYSMQTKESDLCVPLSIQNQEVLNKEKSMIVVLNRVVLNNHKITALLTALFDGLENMKPFAIVMMGEFSDKQNDMNSYKIGFDNLAKLICKYDYLCKETKWIFIPNIDDIGLSETLPRMPICEYVIRNFKKKVKNSYFESNPAKLFFFGVEMMFCRYNAYKAIKKTAIKIAQGNSDAHNLAYTIAAQQNLSPISFYERPILWKYHECLTFKYVPDFIILGDYCSEFYEKIQGLEYINPGNFIQDHTFSVIFPHSKVAQPSKLDI